MIHYSGMLEAVKRSLTDSGAEENLALNSNAYFGGLTRRIFLFFLERIGGFR